MEVSFPSPTALHTGSPVANAPPRPKPTKKANNKRPLSTKPKKVSMNTRGVQDGVISKPKQSKSRNGCTTCKKKRLKCDETKPGCVQCQKRNVVCEGYRKDFKWRQFEEATFTTKPTSKAKRVSSSPPPPSLNRSIPEAPPHNTPSDESSSTPGAGNDFQSPPSGTGRFGTSDGYQSLARTVPYSEPPPLMSPIPASLPPYLPEANCDAFYASHYTDIFGNEAVLGTISLMSMAQDSDPQEFKSTVSSGSPHLKDILLPGTDLNHRPDPSDPRPLQSPFPYQPAARPAEPQVSDSLTEDFDEEIHRDPPMHTTGVSRTMSDSWSFRPSSPARSDSSRSSVSSNLIIHPHPNFPVTSPEMLMMRFDQQTCGILSVKDGPNENPWRTLVWPLAHKSPALRHAIASMSAFHGSKDSRELLMNGVSHMRKSIKELVGEINDMPIDAALATTLALAFSDSWDEHVITGVQHIRGTRALVQRALVKHKALTQAGTFNPVDTERLRFLCNTYVYMDVLARLTSLEKDQEDDSRNFENVMAAFNGPSSSMNEVDPLLGCAATLFPLIGRVATLVQRIRRTDRNSITLVSQATELKQLVQQWQAPDESLIEHPEDPTSDVEHSILTADAYRWATLLYLHQAVPEIASESSLTLAKRILMCLARVPLSSRAIIVQIFPLLTASCEVVDPDDRAWARERWQAMIRRMNIRNVDKCVECVEEVWSRRDAFEAEKAERSWRRQSSRGVSNGRTTPSMVGSGKRKAISFEAEEIGAFISSSGGTSGSFDEVMNRNAKRRATMDPMHMSASTSSSNMSTRPSQQHPSRRPSDQLFENIEPEYTVRGSLHFLGVMRDHQWEVLLG